MWYVPKEENNQSNMEEMTHTPFNHAAWRIRGLQWSMSEGGLSCCRKGHDLNAEDYKHTVSALSLHISLKTLFCLHENTLDLWSVSDLFLSSEVF